MDFDVCQQRILGWQKHNVDNIFRSLSILMWYFIHLLSPEDYCRKNHLCAFKLIRIISDWLLRSWMSPSFTVACLNIIKPRLLVLTIYPYLTSAFLCSSHGTKMIIITAISDKPFPALQLRCEIRGRYNLISQKKNTIKWRVLLQNHF